LAQLSPLRVYIVNQTVHWFIVGIGFPVLVLIALDKGLDIFQAGLALAFYSATTIILELPTGGLADTIGRKRVYLISLSVTFVGYLALVVSWNLTTFAVAATILGAARALSSGSVDAWFVDEFKRTSPGADLQKALAKAGVFIPLGLAAGSLVGGVLPGVLGRFMNSIGTSVYSINFLTSAALVVVQMFLTGILLHEAHHHRTQVGAIAGLKKAPEQVAISVRYGLRNPVLLALTIATIGVGVGAMSVELLWQPRVKELMDISQSTWVLGVLAAGYFLSLGIGSLASMPACGLSKGRYAHVLTVARIAMGAILVIMALQTTMLVFALLYFLLYFVNGIEGSPFSTMFNNEVPSKYRSTLLSFNSLTLQLGGLIGTLAFGYIAGSYSIGTAWEVAGALLMVSSLAYASLMFMKIRAQSCELPFEHEPGIP